MTSLRRFALGLSPFLMLGACAQIIGLSDYETGEESRAGGGGEDPSTGGRPMGGSAGTTGLKPGTGGEDDGGTAGTGGVITPRGGAGGTSGDGGVGGEPDGGDSGARTGGTGGKGGTGPTGGSSTGGAGGRGGMAGSGGASGGAAGSGGTAGGGGSPPCTEIVLPTYIGSIVDGTLTPAVAAYGFEIDPELGQQFPDYFEIQFWDSGGTGSYDGALTGTFPLGVGTDDSNYAFCSRCLIAYEDQDTTREKIYFQTEGSLTIATASMQMEGYPTWAMSDVTLREVTIDADQISTVVPGGSCLHINTHGYSVPAPTNWTCNLAWYSDGDCDCGCGQFDPTCASSNVTSCTYCWCNTASSCTPNEVDTANNWICL